MLRDYVIDGLITFIVLAISPNLISSQYDYGTFRDGESNIAALLEQPMSTFSLGSSEISCNSEDNDLFNIIEINDKFWDDNKFELISTDAAGAPRPYHICVKVDSIE